MNEGESLTLDVRAMFPEAARRADVLERLKRVWSRVVQYPAVARDSWPAVLGVNELTVEIRSDAARIRIANMKGNIASALKTLGYDAGENFTVKIVETVKRERKPAKQSARKVIVDEEKVRQYMSDGAGTLPEDINHALSHLRAYIEALPRNHR